VAVLVEAVLMTPYLLVAQVLLVKVTLGELIAKEQGEAAAQEA
jgi:hypothetical protein